MTGRFPELSSMAFQLLWDQLIDKEHQLQDLRKRDAERAASHRHELSSEEMEERMREFQEQAPLLENLQRELSSAQVNHPRCC